MSWYYKEADEEIGPLTKEEIQELINRKQINRDTLVKRAVADEWRPLAEFSKPKTAKYATSEQPQGEVQQQATASPPNPLHSLQPPNAPGAFQDSQAAETAPGFSAGEVPFKFSGKGGEYFKIWIVNVLLSIVTLGIYSAWAKVRRKQYFYGNLSVSGASFRYLADPFKILKGRVIVFIGFIIISVINSFLPFISPLVSFLMLFALPWLVVRSLMFNARNSAWRNIRFNFTGTYGEAGKAFVLWPVLSVFTLGLLFPYAYYRQKKFFVENSGYGMTGFSFSATAGNYYAIIGLFLLHLILMGAAVFLLSAGMGMLAHASNPGEPEFVTRLMPLIFTGFYLLFYLYGFIYFSVKNANLLYNSGGIKGHRFKSTMRLGAYTGIVLTNTLATVLTLGLFHPFAQVRAFRYKIDNLILLPEGDLDQFVAAEIEETNALGDEAADFMDFDFGL